MGLISAVALIQFIFKHLFLTESFLGCLLAVMNALASRWVERIALKKNKTDFFKILLGLSALRFAVLLGIIVWMFLQINFYKLAIFLAFMVEYFVLLIYHVVNIKVASKASIV